MPGALIAIDQDRSSGTSFGTPGVARKDIWEGNTVRPRCATSGNGTFAWSLLDLPPGSTATLNNPSTATPDITPDVPGTYRLQLITNGGGPGNIQILVFVVLYSATGVLLNNGLRTPALGEAASENNFGGQARGYAADFEALLAVALQSFHPALVKSSAYTLLTTDGNVFADLSSSAFTLTLPSTPFLGERHSFKDHLFHAAAHNLTINGNGKNIEQPGGTTAATLVLNSNGQKETLEYNGTTWSRMA